MLVHNDRGEWELPGGRLEDGESPQECVIRELREEAGVVTHVEQVVDTWVYEVLPGQKVLVVTFGCSADRPLEPARSAEHDDIGVFPTDSLDQIVIPEGYRTSIRSWAWIRSQDASQKVGQ